MTPATPVEALAAALHGSRPEGCTHVLAYPADRPRCEEDAERILAHLPEGWALASVEQVAARLCEMWCEPYEGRLDHGPDAHLGEARRLLLGDGG